MIKSGAGFSPLEENNQARSLAVRVLKRIGGGALIQIGLLLLITLLLVYTLARLVRGVEVAQLWPLVLLALPTGWLLSRPAHQAAHLGSWLSLLLGAVLGLTLVVLRTGGLLDETWRMVVLLNKAAVTALWWGPEQPAPDLAPAAGVLAEILPGSRILIERSLTWLTALLSGSTAFDPAAVALVWGLGVWLVVFWAAWGVRRGINPLAAAGPALALLAASLAASNAAWGVLAPALGATLALMGAAAYMGRELRWEREQVDFSEELRMDASLAVIAIVLALVAGAAMVSYLNIKRMSDFVDRLTSSLPGRDTPIGESLGLERQPGSSSGLPAPAPQSGGVILSLRSGGMPRDHLLGTGSELSDEIVMWISTGELPAGPPGMIPTTQIPRYYWRSLTYDVYTSRGWATSQIETEIYTPEEAAFISGLPTQKRVRQTIVPAIDLGGLIYSAGEILTVDRPFMVEWRRRPDPYSPADYFGASLAEPAPGYSAESWYPQPTPDLLRKAGSDYPAAIMQRYLDLPDRVPDRVRQLALELTATQPTPYDRAHAIESYLRQNYTYSLEVDLPPIQQDIVDYFLFDLKAGYCDYYASSMVVLARLSGLPARLAIGFAPGTYKPYEARYAISAAEAHSWPEIYFPGHGWVVFEPTVSQAVPERRTLDIIPGAQDEPAAPAARSEVDWPRLLLWIGLGLGTLLTLLGGWLLSDPLRLNRLPPGAALATLYARLENLAPRLGLRLAPGHTPAEFAALLEATFEAESGTKIPLANVIIPMLAPASGEAHGITELYARSVYGPRPLQAAEKRQALRLWTRLRWRLLLRRVVQRIQ